MVEETAAARGDEHDEVMGRHYKGKNGGCDAVMPPPHPALVAIVRLLARAHAHQARVDLKETG